MNKTILVTLLSLLFLFPAQLAFAGYGSSGGGGSAIRGSLVGAKIRPAYGLRHGGRGNYGVMRGSSRGYERSTYRSQTLRYGSWWTSRTQPYYTAPVDVYGQGYYRESMEAVLGDRR
jgi:hypothetical protein